MSGYVAIVGAVVSKNGKVKYVRYVRYVRYVYIKDQAGDTLQISLSHNPILHPNQQQQQHLEDPLIFLLKKNQTRTKTKPCLPNSSPSSSRACCSPYQPPASSLSNAAQSAVVPATKSVPSASPSTAEILAMWIVRCSKSIALPKFAV